MTSTHNETCGTRQLDHNSAQRLPERWTTHLRNNQYSIYMYKHYGPEYSTESDENLPPDQPEI